MDALRKIRRHRLALGWAAGALLLLGVTIWSEAAPARPTSKLRYNRDVRPLLAENCFACHGPDSATRASGLRLDRPADATVKRAGGNAAIVPGDPARSEIIRRITTPGPLLMPPTSSHKKLTPPQIATLKRWVAEGAQYEAHWAYIAPRLSVPPPTKDTKWARNPIDRFVLARLEQEKLRPAPEADRRTLARRVSLDLTGLPPEPADVEAFVADPSPNAYEKLVDKYLASPQWGEHRSRYWLDAARYADTHGIHIDNYREIWSYRDWVIRAFNANMPFSRFTLEQLAGDLLPNPTLDQKIATGFNRCNITTSEGGAIPEEYAVLYTRDRTETASQVWLGATAGCAVCHDHKFDPITQRGFYELSAFFNNTTQNPMDGNVQDTPPNIFVPQGADRPRFAALSGDLKAARGRLDARRTAARPDFDRWLSAADPNAVNVPGEGLRLHVPLAEGKGAAVQATFEGKPLALTATAEPGWEAGHVAASAFVRRANSTVEIAGAGDYEKDQPFTVALWVKTMRPDQGGSLVARMDDQSDYRGWDVWLEGGRVGTHRINKWPENALKVVTREPLTPGVWHHVCIAASGGNGPESLRIFVDGAPKEFDVPTNALRDSIRTTVPLKLGQRHTTSAVDGTAFSDLRLYDRALSPDEAAGLAGGTRVGWLLSRPAAQRSDAEKTELLNWWLPARDGAYRTLAAGVAALENEERTIRGRGTVALVAQERAEPATAFVLFRGEYDQRRDQVKPTTPDFLPALSPDQPRNRLGFARWLLKPENPLTARVTVNRFWQEVFGQGLVRSVGDFGVMGELPSHPELLDWLAVHFRESGWDVKRFFRLMVTSATYRQSAVLTPEKERRDPSNRLLARGPRFRMDAEMIRDYALASSGLLTRKIGGPSVRPYQPDGVWESVTMPNSNTYMYRRDNGENLYRRSLYTFWKRSAPPASLDIFNAPSREVCTVRRERTNTPLQALVTLNDTQYVEAARALAQRALKEGGASPNARANYLARRLLARPLRAEEQAVVAKNISGLETYYAAHPKEARELVMVGDSKADPAVKPEQLAAWTMLTNTLLNLDEVLNK